MLAARLQTPAPADSEPLGVDEVDDPSTGRGDVLIEVAACGACHTDLHIVEGELPPRRSPLIPGHQIVGSVCAVGEGVSEELLGLRVGVPWMSSTCGECESCRSGRENLCASARFTGYDIDGGFAERVAVPWTSVYQLPDGLSDIDAAPLLCAGIIGYRSLRLSEAQPGQRLGLFGFGASAHLTIQVAVHQGCEVFVFTRGVQHRELAKKLGATWVGGVDDSPPAPLHAAVTFAPAGSVVREALRHTGAGGTVAVNAIHMDAVPELDYREHLYGERTLRSVTNLTRQDAEEFLQLAVEIPVRTTATTYGLREVNDALADMKASRVEGAAVIVP